MTPFTLLSTHDIPTLQARLEEYRDPSSGARHIHLANDDAELAFLVAFPTVPDNNDGRAHILEHLALSGSERYPVRDPFFSMTRRSTATFMNAMTYADRTIYPFASTDRRDFFNLLDVYLDATFFPRLDYLGFLQEGWRHVLDGNSLSYHGVVFNEMKGALADPGRILYQGVAANLLKGTTYEVISGGDPPHIPDLTHEALKEFHASHYHPSQALFMTAGSVQAADIQRCIADRVLARRPGHAPLKMPQLAEVAAPVQATIKVPAQRGRDDGFGVQFAWILGESANGTAFHQARLLEAGLLGDASAPLRKTMESAGFGRPSRLNGVDASPRQLVFHLGMEGLQQHQMADAQIRIRGALEQVAQSGVPEPVLRAALRNIRYQQRNTARSNMPNVLTRMLNVVPVAMRGGDVHAAFDAEQVLAQLEARIADAGYFKDMLRTMLDSPQRLVATVMPDAEYFAKRDAAEQQRLQADMLGLDDAGRRRILDDQAALLAQQRQVQDRSVLPRMTPGDVAREPRPLPRVDADGPLIRTVSIPSNGISYAQVHFDVSTIGEPDWPWLQLYATLRRDLGVGPLTYDEADAWREQSVPSFAVQLVPVLEHDALKLSLQFQAGGLREEHQGIADVLAAYIGRPRFDESERIAFLCTQLAQQRVKGLAQQGDHYAALRCTAGASPLRRFQNLVDGIDFLPFAAMLRQLVATAEGTAWIGRQLERIHALVTSSPVTVICAGSGTDVQDLASSVTVPPAPARPLDESPATRTARMDEATGTDYALYAPSQVNHCYMAWSVPDERHPDAAALAIAAELLTQQFLHTSIREKGGAYGGNAAYAHDAGVFTLKSFRDPRLVGTYDDFAAALNALVETSFTDEQVEQAIISVVKSLDLPRAPIDAVTHALNLQRRGITDGDRARYRTAVLDCTIDQVQTVARQWLRGRSPFRTAFVGNVEQDLANLSVVDLVALSETGQAAS